MRSIIFRLLLSVWLFAVASSAIAQDEVSFSKILAKDGLSGTAIWLKKQPKTPENKFLLGGVQALSAIEYILQVRYDNYSGQLPLVPGGRAQIEYNPDAVFDPSFVEIALKGALAHLAKAEKTLQGAVGQDFNAQLNIADIWFDINKNGKRDENEDLFRQLALLPQFTSGKGKSSIIDFDKADANWLAAYVQVLSGMSEMVLALDPTSAIKTVIDGRAMIEEKGTLRRDPFFGEDATIDSIAILITAIKGVPDKKRTRAALAHFKSMIEHNKDFWRLVMQETDNEAEWLPNPSQTSVFGMSVDEEMAKGWQNVLVEISDVLEGKALIPHWRVGAKEGSQDGVGINFAKLMNDPGDFDIILMLHGAAIAPYLESGKIADMEAWQDFSRLTGGQGMLFSLWFN